MIFKPEHVRLILAGRKTQTRRHVKEGEERCRYRPGHSYAVQPGRGKPEVARIRVLDVRRVFLHEIDEADARAEGFKPNGERSARDAFLGVWWELHHEGPGREGSPEYPILIPVWAITFELEQEEQPRFLRPKSGYTADPHEALPDEPEALDAKTLNLMAAASARDLAERYEQIVQARRKLDLADRLRELESAAQSAGIDISKDMRVIERRVGSIEQRLRARAA